MFMASLLHKAYTSSVRPGIEASSWLYIIISLDSRPQGRALIRGEGGLKSRLTREVQPRYTYSMGVSEVATRA